MNVLFLDDNPIRRKMFLSEVPSAQIVDTVAECIKKLEEEEWDYVLLDHDLGGETFVDSSRGDTGMEVVRWILEKKPKIGHVVVHSHNVPAANRMISLLEDGGYHCWYTPFRYRISEELI